MDCGGGSSGSENYNPRETASIFSIVTFCYNYKILRKGTKKDIEEKDVFKVMPEYEAERLGDKLESQWKQQKKQNKDASIKMCLIRCFGWTYFFYGIAHLVFSTAVILLSPTVISKFVAYFQPGQTTLTTSDAYRYAFGIIGLNLMTTLYNNNFQQLVVEYSIKVRTAVCSLIFRKALKLSPVAFSEISVGKVVTLMSKDVFSIDAGLSFLKDMIIGFLQLAVVSYILYRKVGVSAFPAVGVMLLIIPIQLYTGKRTTEGRIKTAKKTDQRFKLLQETLSAIKIIKMYTWQNFFEKLIHKARLKETDRIKIVYYLKAFIVTLGSSSINLAFYILLVSYVARGYTVEAETVYYVQTCLGAIKTSITISIPFGIAQNADMLAALRRIQLFLDAEEVQKTPATRAPLEDPSLHLNKVKVDINGKEVLKSISLNLNKGLLLITGNVGSGKSILLKTILGEYPISAGDIITHGTFSYATEEPWLFPSTIRQNILFGQPYNEKRYKEVLNVCALTYDINKFDKLDQTIVGDKGVNLSKGQQSRITLARAVYRESDIYLLDDCLSSLDNHVNKHIFNECIKGFLKDKLCVLVTNNINNIKTVSNSNILFIDNGSTLTLDQQRDALDKRITYYIDEDDEFVWKRFSRKIPENREIFEEDFDEIEIPKNREIFEEEFDESDTLLHPNGISKQSDKLENLYYEEKKEGKVLCSTYFRYYRFIGGAFAALSLFVVFLTAQFCISYSDKLISLWVNLEPHITSLTNNNQTGTEEYQEAIKSREQFMNIYTILTAAVMILILLRSYSSFFFCINGARKLHRAMVKAMLNAYMYFFDDHFIGNIINRLSKDFDVIDEYMPFLVFDSYRNDEREIPKHPEEEISESSSESSGKRWEGSSTDDTDNNGVPATMRTSEKNRKTRSFDEHLFFGTIGIFILVASVNWMFFIPAGFLLIKFFFVQRLYQPTGRSLTRLVAATRSPIIGYLNSSLEGLPVIRAAQQQYKLQSEFDRHQDLFTSTSYMNQSAMRFFTFVLDMFGLFFLAGVVIKFIIFPEGAKAGDVGLAISQAMMLSGFLQYAVRQITELENVMTSVERVLEYSDVKPEVQTGQVPTNWPTNGSIRYNNVSLTYKSDGNTVLKNISFEIEGQSKVGIVGRTGAGKSSIISTLFRLYDFDGQIFIDEANIVNLSLDYLRSRIAIIPQDPIMFSGTIRTNIDPFHRYSDAEIWSVLEKVHMRSTVTNLNQQINDSFSIYSSGQKQLFCLARALIQNNKIIVLDEATANLDPETDQLLQKTVEECFKNCTVITIAHRLHSVMSCDKVIVLDAGRIVEFDEPNTLLNDTKGVLYKMVQEETFSNLK